LNLIVDIGNTRIKAGLFEKNELILDFVFESAAAFPMSELFAKYPIKHCIVATVVDKMDAFILELKEQAKTLVFTSETPSPLKNLYRSVQSLGSDRLAAAVGGNFLFPDKNMLVIDAGTCIKYNFVSSKNEYLGGAISPGLQMRFKALSTFTSRLPLLDLDDNFNTLIGSTTNESILSGVEIGAIAETEGIIEQYKQLYPDIIIVLTGGDVNFFEKRLKSRIFTDSFLILKGLNSILEHNLDGSGFSH